LGFSFEFLLLLKYQIANNHHTWFPGLSGSRPFEFYNSGLQFSFRIFSSTDNIVPKVWGFLWRECEKEYFLNDLKMTTPEVMIIPSSDAYGNQYGWFVSASTSDGRQGIHADTQITLCPNPHT
jgi:hypothetical protein